MKKFYEAPTAEFEKLVYLAAIFTSPGIDDIIEDEDEGDDWDF